MKGTTVCSVVERSFYRWRSSNKKGRGGWIRAVVKAVVRGESSSHPPLLLTHPVHRERRSTYNERRQRFSIIPGRKPGAFHMRETYDSGRRRDSTHRMNSLFFHFLFLVLLLFFFFFFDNHRVAWLYRGSWTKRSERRQRIGKSKMWEWREETNENVAVAWQTDQSFGLASLSPSSSRHRINPFLPPFVFSFRFFRFNPGGFRFPRSSGRNRTKRDILREVEEVDDSTVIFQRGSHGEAWVSHQYKSVGRQTVLVEVKDHLLNQNVFQEATSHLGVEIYEKNVSGKGNQPLGRKTNRRPIDKQINRRVLRMRSSRRVCQFVWETSDARWIYFNVIHAGFQRQTVISC